MFYNLYNVEITVNGETVAKISSDIINEKVLQPALNNNMTKKELDQLENKIRSSIGINVKKDTKIKYFNDTDKNNIKEKVLEEKKGLNNIKLKAIQIVVKKSVEKDKSQKTKKNCKLNNVKTKKCDKKEDKNTKTKNLKTKILFKKLPEHVESVKNIITNNKDKRTNNNNSDKNNANKKSKAIDKIFDTTDINDEKKRFIIESLKKLNKENLRRLSKATNISVGSLYDYRSGRCKLSLERCRLIANEFSSKGDYPIL